MLDNLPSELLAQILVRLPVRTLLSLKCLCKTLLCFIDTPDFAYLHFKSFNSLYHGVNGTRLILVERPVKLGLLKGAQFVTLYGNQLIETAKFEIPIDWGSSCAVMGCVHGLLLLYKSPLRKCDPVEMILWNPLIRKSLIIPESHVSQPLRNWADLALGYEPESNDYRVAVLVLSTDSESGLFFEIYSFKNGSWTSIKIELVSGTWFLGHKVYLDGFIHWVVGGQPHAPLTRYLSYLISINLRTDSYCYIELPSFGNKWAVKFPMVIDGLLAVGIVSFNHIGILVRIAEQGKWCWGKMFESDCKQVLFDYLKRGISNAIFFPERSELLVSLHGRGVVSYNFNTHVMFLLNDCATYIGTYDESLFWRELTDPVSDHAGESRPTNWLC